MNTNEIITALRKEVSSNKTFNTVCHVFAFRKRARNILTMNGLTQRMKLEGFEFESSEYVKVLKFLSSLGLGKLEMEGNKVVALKDIRVTLQSIGEVAVGTQTGFKSFKQRNSYQALRDNNTKVVDKVWQAPPTKVSLAIEVKGKLVKLEIPVGLTGEELADVILGIQSIPFPRRELQGEKLTA